MKNELVFGNILFLKIEYTLFKHWEFDDKLYLLIQKISSKRCAIVNSYYVFYWKLLQLCTP